MKKVSLKLALTVLLSLAAALAAGAAQGSGDYLNEQEVDRVREAQEIELRTRVFLFIAERRLKVLTGELKQQSKKDEELWGPLPTGAPAFLLEGYGRSISELMDKLDDAHERDPKAEGLKKALKRLLDGTDQHLKSLATLRAQLTDPEVRRAIDRAEEAARLANEGARSGAAK